MCMNVLSARTPVYPLFAWYLVKTRRGCWISQNGSYSQQCWESNPSLLKEQVLITVGETSLQPLDLQFKINTNGFLCICFLFLEIGSVRLLLLPYSLSLSLCFPRKSLNHHHLDFTLCYQTCFPMLILATSRSIALPDVMAHTC